MISEQNILSDTFCKSEVMDSPKMPAKNTGSFENGALTHYDTNARI